MEIVNSYESKSVNNTFKYFPCWINVAANEKSVRNFLDSIQKNTTKKRRVTIRDINNMISKVSTDDRWHLNGQLKIVVQKVNFNVTISGGTPGYWCDLAFLYAISQNETVQWYIYGYAKARYLYGKLDVSLTENGSFSRNANNIGFSVYNPGGQRVYTLLSNRWSKSEQP